MKYIKLFENKKKVDWNKVLHDATWTHKKISERVWKMDLDKIKLAVENGANVDSCETLSWAVRMNNYEVVKYMLENGANVNYQNPDGKWTPLMNAADDGTLEIAKLLIDYDADPLLGNFQDTNTMDILEHEGELKNASVGYNSSSTKGKKIKDEIYKYIMQHIVDKNPEKAPNYIEYLSDEQKEKYKHFIDAEKYNL